MDIWSKLWIHGSEIWRLYFFQEFLLNEVY